MGFEYSSWNRSHPGVARNAVRYAIRPGQVLCTGGILYNPGTQHPHYVTLPYSRTWHQNVFTCTSRVTGLTCTNRAGHGVFISRESWRTW